MDDLRIEHRHERLEVACRTRLEERIDDRPLTVRVAVGCWRLQDPAERFGDPFSVAMTGVQRARILEHLGRFQDALPSLESAIATFEDLGARWELADAAAERGDAQLGLGQLDSAEDDLTRALRISEELGELQLRSWMWRSLAKVSEQRGDERKADERWRRSREAEEWRSRVVRDRATMPRH